MTEAPVIFRAPWGLALKIVSLLVNVLFAGIATAGRARRARRVLPDKLGSAAPEVAFRGMVNYFRSRAIFSYLLRLYHYEPHLSDK